MNAADGEVIALEDTLFKLRLLLDTSESAAVKEKVLAEVMTDGSVAVLGEYDITPYATDPLHEEKVMNILSKIGVMDTAEQIDDYIDRKYLSSPVTGTMIMSAASAYDVDARLMMAIMEQDSRFGTVGVAVRTLNPGNVGNDDSGNTRTYGSWQEGVTAVAEWLSRHRASQENPDETVVEPTEPATASSSDELLLVTPPPTTTPPASSSFSPTPTPTTTPIVIVSPSPTASPSYSPTPIPPVTTPIVIVSPSPTASPSYSPTPSPTPTPEATAPPSTPTPTPEPSPSPTPESSPTPPPEPSATPTPEPQATASPEET